MLFKSPRDPIHVPATDLLSYMFDDWKHGWDKPLFVDADDPTQVLTAGDLVDLIKRIGYGLRHSCGVKAGEVVLMTSANGLLVPGVILGIMAAGAIFSGANPKFNESELAYQIRDTRTKVILASADTFDVAVQAALACGLPKSSVFLVSLDRGKSFGMRTLGDLTGSGKLDWERISDLETMRKRVAVLNYSSGTTGLPKGCMVSVYNIVAQAHQQAVVRDSGRKGLQKQGVNVPSNYNVLAFLPFYHAYGQQHYVINAARSGDTTYIMSSFSLSAFLKHITEYDITTFAAVPPIAVLLAKHPNVRKTDFSRILPIICGAAPLGIETQLQAEDAMQAYSKSVGRYHPCMARIMQGWGMSEGVCGSTNFAMHERDPDVSGVGFLFSGMSMLIVDDEGKEMGYDEPGEVLLKGPNIFLGYWNKVKETKDAFTEDGWYKTGDIGLVKKKTGVLHIVDRKKELIKVKGLQVAPAELEDVLLKSPDVEDAAVIGISGDGTEYPRAYVVPTQSRLEQSKADPENLARNIINFVGQQLSKHKHITGGVIFIDAIPKNPSGKILRRQLRDRSKDGGERVWAVNINSTTAKSKL